MARTPRWSAALLITVLGCGPEPQDTGQRGAAADASSPSPEPSMEDVTEQIDGAKEQGRTLVAEFAGHLEAKRYGDAYALMSPIYKSSVTSSEFERVVSAQPHIAQMTGLECFEFRGSPGSWFRYDRCVLEHRGVKAFAVVYFDVSESGDLGISSLTAAGLPAVPVPGFPTPPTESP